MIIMVDTRTWPATRETTMERIVGRVKAIMMNWGVGEGCSFVYAILIAAGEPLSAEEIGERTDYAYSSTINHLNTLIRMGLVTRIRRIRKNLYRANMNFVELIKAERARVMGYLNQLREDLEGVKDLEHLKEKVDRALLYLGRIETVADEILGE